MKKVIYILLFVAFVSNAQGQEQSSINMSLGNSLVTSMPDGRYMLSDAGASYFAQLSLTHKHHHTLAITTVWYLTY